MGTDRASVLIGVDGGATEVKVHEVEVLRGPPDLLLRAGTRSRSKVYERVDGFRPLSLEEQRAQVAAPVLSPEEREQGREWVESTARCVAHVAKACGGGEARLGIAMPGLKTTDGRGIALALNGPRIPDFLDQLEARLAEAGVKLAAPLGRLQSDGECCGLGEEYAEDGLFREVRNAYYLGGGTGLAESLKLDGELVPLERVGDWFPKAWSMSCFQESYERMLTVAGMNRSYAELSRRPRGGEPCGFLEDHVHEDLAALSVLRLTAEALGHLLARRLATLWARSRAEPEHPGPFVLDRIVIGQRLGQLFADFRTRPHLSPRSIECLLGFLGSQGDVGFVSTYVVRSEEREPPKAGSPSELKAWRFGRLSNPDLLAASTLRAAPAIGAAASALLGR